MFEGFMSPWIMGGFWECSSSRASHICIPQRIMVSSLNVLPISESALIS